MLTFTPLLSPCMERRVMFRLRILQLIELGISQKAIAHRLQISETTMNRWLNEGAYPAGMDHEDRFDHYLADLQQAITRDYNQLSKAEIDRLHATAETRRAERRLKKPRRSTKLKSVRSPTLHRIKS